MLRIHQCLPSKHVKAAVKISLLCRMMTKHMWSLKFAMVTH